MKKIIRFKAFLIMLTALAGLSLISCNNNDDNQITPPSIEDVNGSYIGKLITTQGTFYNETKTEFTAKDNLITFADLPVKEIVNSAVSDPVKAKKAVAAIEKVKYELKYITKPNNVQSNTELEFMPELLEFKITVDGAVKKIKVKFTADQKGVYTENDRSLKFELTAEQITVDSVVLPPSSNVKYSFPSFIKKQ